MLDYTITASSSNPHLISISKYNAIPLIHVISFYVYCKIFIFFFFFSSRRRHTRWNCDWSSDVCSSDLAAGRRAAEARGDKRQAAQLRRGGHDVRRILRKGFPRRTLERLEAEAGQTRRRRDARRKEENLHPRTARERNDPFGGIRRSPEHVVAPVPNQHEPIRRFRLPGGLHTARRVGSRPRKGVLVA